MYGAREQEFKDWGVSKADFEQNKVKRQRNGKGFCNVEKSVGIFSHSSKVGNLIYKVVMRKRILLQPIVCLRSRQNKLTSSSCFNFPESKTFSLKTVAD